MEDNFHNSIFTLMAHLCLTFPLPSVLKEVTGAIASLQTCSNSLENAIYYFTVILSLIHTRLFDCRVLFYIFHF